MEVPVGHGILGDVSYTDESSAMFLHFEVVDEEGFN